jgi:hypothetical protein
MKNPIDRLSVHPLFFDALSGEFIPTSDPQQRQHTLGRLAYAAFTKSDLIPADDMHVVNTIGDPFMAVYRPSWAPTVETTVTGSLEEDDHAFRLTGIELLNEQGELLRISNHYYNEEQNSFQMKLPGGRNGPVATTVSGSLALGDGLSYARAKITQEAERFFETVS